MNLRETLNLAFLSHLLATPKGRAYVLNQVAEAESSSEGDFFERTLRHVEDPALQKMIEKHQADEVRHAALFSARKVAQGVDPGTIPDELRFIDRLDRNLGGFFQRPIESGRDVMEVYTLLQAIEERAVTQFAVMEKGFREVDPDTADVFAEVSKDEERHLKYCQAIARRYARSEAERLYTLARFRRAEAESYRDNSAASMRYALDHVVEPGLTTSLWRAFSTLTSRSTALPLTRFAAVC
jgi:rubrerythrin